MVRQSLRLTRVLSEMTQRATALRSGPLEGACKDLRGSTGWICRRSPIQALQVRSARNKFLMVLPGAGARRHTSVRLVHYKHIVVFV